MIVNDSIITDNILHYYKEYQDIFEIPLPLITINYYNSEENTISWACVNFKNKEDVTLSVNRLAYSIYKDFKSFLFHEFTHIFDKMTNETINDEVGDISSFSEIHATYIQLQSSFNIIKQNGIKVSLDDSICYLDATISLNEYINKSFMEVLNLITEFRNTRVLENFSKSYKHALYYFGIIRFCEEFCSDDIKEFYNFKFFEKNYGSAMIDIFNLVKHPFEITKDTASLIKEKERGVKNKAVFIKTFGLCIK